MADIARLRIELDEVEPRVFRRVEVPVDIRLDRLHLVIQAAMGWENYHLWEFRRGDAAWGIPDPSWSNPERPVHAAKAASLADLLGAQVRKFTYVYDFGDNWHHTVRVEAIAGPEPEARYPRFLDGQGACPPEDVGGFFGYMDFLDVIADPAHERREELLEWCGGAFDPADIAESAIRQQMDKLAPKPPRKRTPRASAPG
jgi:Plasmid pRiA4b ORF-3-like protein